MMSSLSRWFRRRPRTGSHRAAGRKKIPCKPHLEQLEDRVVPSTMSISDASAIEGSGTMKFIDAFVSPQSGGLREPRGIDVRARWQPLCKPRKHLYRSGATGLCRYDAGTGAFIDVFASDPTLSGAKDVEFGPDGNLYVPNNVGDNVYRFNGTTGAFMDVFVATGSGGLDTPRSVISPTARAWPPSSTTKRSA